MAYTDDNTINLEDCGAPELWVTYKRPGMLTHEENMEYISKHATFNDKLKTEQDYIRISDYLDDIDAAFAHTMSLIVSWNLTQKETNEVLPVPSENSEIWKQAREFYIQSIVKQINNDPTNGFLSAGQVQNPVDQMIPETNGKESLMPTVKP